jgi:hypothetical protein
MVSWPILVDHGLGLMLLWGWVALTGIALAPLLRLHIGRAGVPLLGIAFWPPALYLLRFPGGLDLAAATILMLAGLAIVRVWRSGSFAWRRPSWSTLVLVLGSIPYLATSLLNYVPLGMDATMHTTNAVLIARSGGLPSDYTPFLQDVPFPAVNLGLPTVASLAIRWGGDPAAVMLASHHLTFTAMILATFLLVRRWTKPNTAAVLAVVSVWMARSSQNTVAWGGYPTIMSVAMGIFACRLLLQLSRSTPWQSVLATGWTIASIPFIHGVGAGTWLYCAGTWTCVACLCNARHWKSTLARLLGAGTTTLLLLMAYRFSGAIELQGHEMERIRFFATQHAPKGEGALPVESIAYLVRNAESIVVWAGWAALGMLAWRRHWGPLLILTGAWLSLLLVICNSHWYRLPASFLLYPERVLYWAAPLCAVGLALALRAWGTAPITVRFTQGNRWILVTASVAILLLAGYYHNKLYQRFPLSRNVDQDSWDALVWAKDHLQPERDYVSANYNTAGSYLPALAQVACTGAHFHLFYTERLAQAKQRRTVSHVFVDHLQGESPEVHEGRIVFQNRAVTIVELARQPATGALME